MRHHLTLITATLCSGALYAAQPPDAGQSLDSLKPPAARPAESGAAVPEREAPRPPAGLPTDVKFQVKGFRIAGARAIPGDELLPLIQDAVGQEKSLAELQELAGRITERYQAQGYLLARAYLPAQDIRDGVVEIAVLEGRLGKVQVKNESLVAPSVAARHLGALHPDDIIEAGPLERQLLLLNDLPGVEARSTLKPGASVGTSDLDIELRGDRRLSGSLELDNHGNRYTGEVRGGATLNIDSPAGLGDALTLRATSAGKGLNYGRAAYQLPVGGNGTKAGLAGSSLRYELGKDFASLDAHGRATIATGYLVHPFVRSRRSNLNAQLSYEHKSLTDEVDATATRSDKRIDLWTLGLSGDRLDGLGAGGIVQYSLSVVSGRLQLDAANAALDRAGHDTAGRYAKLAYQLSRIQQLDTRWSLSGQGAGQRTHKNLDSSEKFSLGGAQGVRAYPQGEASSDDAWLLNLELRYALAAEWQVAGFYDAGRGRTHHAPLAGDSTRPNWRSGAGLGLAWSRPRDWAVQSFVAWKTAGDPTSDIDRTPRLWLQAVKSF